MFNLIVLGDPGSDQTWSYKVELNGEYTVETFIQDVLSKKDEWGRISIDRGCRYDEPSIEYKHGVALGTMPQEILGLKVVSAKANGGWSYMGYRLTLENVNGKYIKVTDNYGILPENIYGDLTYNVYRNNNVSPDYVIASFRLGFAAINECHYMEKMLNIKE